MCVLSYRTGKSRRRKEDKTRIHLYRRCFSLCGGRGGKEREEQEAGGDRTRSVLQGRRESIKVRKFRMSKKDEAKAQVRDKKTDQMGHVCVIEEKLTKTKRTYQDAQLKLIRPRRHGDPEKKQPTTTFHTSQMPRTHYLLQSFSTHAGNSFAKTREVALADAYQFAGGPVPDRGLVLGRFFFF